MELLGDRTSYLTISSPQKKIAELKAAIEVQFKPIAWLMADTRLKSVNCVFEIIWLLEYMFLAEIQFFLSPHHTQHGGSVVDNYPELQQVHAFHLHCSK